jgi:hypothetical protein
VDGRDNPSQRSGKTAVTDTDTDTAPRLPTRTTPTWDQELLVSAASVFTLVQLPGWMDGAFLALRPRLDLDWEILARLLYTYGKLGLLLLAGAFALHVGMRAYWIALVGMDSIYPEGVRWDRLRMGPIRRRFLHERSPPIAERIERADNRASIVFAVGLTMAMLQVGLIVLMVGAYVLTLGLARGLGWSWLLPNGVFAVVTLVVAPFAIAALVDRQRGATLPPDGPLARAVRGVYAFYARVGYGLGGNPTIELLQSYIGARRTMGYTLAALAICGVVAVAQLALQQRGLALGDYARWPQAEEGRADSLLPAHYRDQATTANALLPTIDSAFAANDHLRLVVPFNPKRLPAQLDATCAPAWRGEATPARRTALLDCVGRWLALRLDGQALPPPRLRYTSDARSGQQAVLAVLAIGALAPGEHELRLRRALSPSQRERGEPDDYVIVFWK